ncbi:MAG: GDP-mannose 4,6-dehydratase [Vicinamibacteria bacterium]
MAEGERRALITGVTGQDGSYLAEQLLERGYEVHGILRRSSSPNTARIEHLLPSPDGGGGALQTHYADLSDSSGLAALIDRVHPDEIYHLGAQSQVDVSFELPVQTFDITGTGTVRLLEALREAGVDARFCQACSSEMFGSSPAPQSESTRFAPRNPYAIAKLASYWAAVNYREAYGMHIVNGILFNHESPRRGEAFVTRKITRGVARIRAGIQERIPLGNLDAKRDWGYSPDYMRALQLMVAAPEPDDFVVATGRQHSVRDFLALACECAGIDDPASRYEIDPRFFRPTDVDSLCGDAAKIRARLGWEPTLELGEMVRMMVEADIAELEISTSSSFAGRAASD